ncbi:MAG: 6-bladed beta-propeller, partial [Anaerolineae bacterium]|nr:6-bladed beta-propeller [Anaerolineae bacterium]
FASTLGEIARLVHAGKKIDAVKLYRQTFDAGLQEAKDAVDRIERGESIEITRTMVKPVTSTRVRATSVERRGTGCAWWLWLLVIGIIGIPLVLTILPLALNFSALKEDLQSAFAPPSPTVTRTLTPTPTRVPSPTPTPLGFASAVLTFGGKGTGAGLFEDARSIALDGAGNIYVAEYSGGRVQVFDATGKFVTQWFVGDSKTRISSMAANRQGTVYVVADGKILRVEGATGKSLGKLEYADGDRFDAVTLTPEGGLLATWYEARYGIITSIQGHRDDLVRFDAEGKATQVLRGVISSLTGYAELYNYPAVDGRGNIFIAGGSFDSAVFKFTREGKFVDRFGSRGDAPGQFGRIQAIAVDNQSRVYVADTRIQVFDATGRYLGMFQGSAWAMVFNDRNELFTVRGTQVTKFRLNQP